MNILKMLSTSSYNLYIVAYFMFGMYYLALIATKNKQFLQIYFLAVC